MKRLLCVCLASALGASAVCAAAAPAPKGAKKPKGGPLSAQFLGEGGGYTHPDSETSPYLEAAPAVSPKADPRRQTEAARSSPAAESAPRRDAAALPNVLPYRPSDGPRRAPAAAPAEAATADSASDDARRDYESRLLGAPPEAARPALTGAPSGAPLNVVPYGQSAGAAGAPEGNLFVQFELDPREAGSLRDAVAGLGAAAAFRPDARFQPTPGAGGSVRISGWLPVSRLSAAIARPGVKRVAVDRTIRSRPASGAVGDFLVGLRVADAARAEQEVSAGVKDLTKSAGFVAGNAYKVGRAFGVETLSDGGAVAVVAGSLPLSRLARAMGRPGVVRVTSAAPRREEAAADSAGTPEGRAMSFLRFVRTRGWGLMLVTILLGLPTIGRAFKKGLAVFVPYR